MNNIKTILITAMKLEQLTRATEHQMENDHDWYEICSFTSVELTPILTVRGQIHRTINEINKQ